MVIAQYLCGICGKVFEGEGLARKAYELAKAHEQIPVVDDSLDNLVIKCQDHYVVLSKSGAVSEEKHERMYRMDLFGFDGTKSKEEKLKYYYGRNSPVSRYRRIIGNGKYRLLSKEEFELLKKRIKQASNLDMVPVNLLRLKRTLPKKK